jgi:hypothetical protein
LPCLVSVMRIFQATEIDGSVVPRLEIPEKSAIVVDLAEVSFIDADDVELLRELSSRRVSVSNGSLFVMQRLEAIEEKR